MAKIIIKDDSLIRRYRGYLKAVLIGGAVFAAGTLTMFISVAIGIICMPVMIAGSIADLLGIVLISAFGSKASSLKYGIKGERDTAALISRLPDGYYGIQNATVSFEGKQSEIDMIVVGPSGVFIVESKSRNGRVTGNYDAKYWTQHKVGRGGTPYSSDFYSPVKQVGTHVYRLAHFLRSRGMGVNIEGAVYMSSDDSVVSIGGTPGRIPVFTNTPDGIDRLYRFILSGKADLSRQSIGTICNSLLKE